MNINRLKQIIQYSNENKNDIEYKIKDFYASAQMNSDRELLNLMQIVRPLFHSRGYIIVEMPFSDNEIGALCYKGDFIGYTFLNTSLPKVNVNFALCHEIYHVFYQETEFFHKVELLNEHYYEYGEEMAANLFAGMLLMPEQSFKNMYYKFYNEKKNEDNNLSVLIKLMSYFEAPYMSVLIRCCELKLIKSGDILENLISIDTEGIRKECKRLWLDEGILNATNRDNYDNFECLVKSIGEQYSEEGYINNRTVDKALQNMRLLYDKIRRK